MTFGLSFVLGLTLLLLQPPILEGACTWYPPTGDLMRNGYAYDPTAATCAINGDIFYEHVGETWLLCTRSRCVPCVISDSGDPDEFRKHGIVADVTPAVALLLMGRLSVGRVDVRVWRMN